jgi:hypothetical protein
MSPLLESWILIATAGANGVLAAYCLITAVDLLWPPREPRR